MSLVLDRLTTGALRPVRRDIGANVVPRLLAQAGGAQSLRQFLATIGPPVRHRRLEPVDKQCADRARGPRKPSNRLDRADLTGARLPMLVALTPLPSLRTFPFDIIRFSHIDKHISIKSRCSGPLCEMGAQPRGPFKEVEGSASEKKQRCCHRRCALLTASLLRRPSQRAG
jgi:hypothetical protein